MASDPTAVTKLYERIPLDAMQQLSDSYMAWYVDRVTRQLDEIMAGLRAELRENDAKEASFCPTPAELQAIERLQQSGVTGVDLLDRMVEQGEDWLLLTMRRLDHFERTGLAPKDYSTWCEHALGGAYDWIDHNQIAASSPAGGSGKPAASGGAVPDWLGNRAPARPDDGPTAPVPSVNRGNFNGGVAQQQSAGGQQQGGEDDKGRNIFRIFTN